MLDNVSCWFWNVHIPLHCGQCSMILLSYTGFMCTLLFMRSEDSEYSIINNLTLTGGFTHQFYVFVSLAHASIIVITILLSCTMNPLTSIHNISPTFLIKLSLNSRLPKSDSCSKQIYPKLMSVFCWICCGPAFEVALHLRKIKLCEYIGGW